MGDLKEIFDKIKQGKVVFRAEDIILLNYFYDNTIKFALIFDKGNFKDTPVIYFLSTDKITDKIEIGVQKGLSYVEGEYIIEGNLKDALLLSKENLKTKTYKKHEEKSTIDFLSEFPILPKMENRSKFSKSELLAIEKQYNTFVKDLSKKSVFEL